MLDLVRMDLYRMFRTKSFYVILILLCGIIFLFSYTSSFSFNLFDNDISGLVKEMKKECDVFVDLGGKSIPVTLDDINSAMFSIRIAGMLLLTFVSVFSSGEYKSGFIKNIAGQTSHRSNLVIARTITVVIYNLLFFALSLLLEILFSALCQKYIVIEDTGNFIKDILFYLLLHIAASLVCVMICYVTKSSALTNIFAVMIGTGILASILSLISLLIEYLTKTDKDIELQKYAISTAISRYGNDSDETGFILILGIAYIVLTTAVSLLFVNKKDIT